MADRGLPRAVLGGLGLGYLAFALTVANYTSSNPYYSLPLIPILSLSIGVLAGFTLRKLRVVGPRAALPLSAGIVLLVATAAYKSHSILAVMAPQGAIEDYVRIGERTNHTTRAIVVDNELSTPVMYWGWLVGRSWEFPDDHLPPHLAAQRWDYLIVVGEDYLETSRGLREFTNAVPVVAKTDRYAIFDLRGLPARAVPENSPP